MVPTIIVAEMLGVPEDRHADFRRWSKTIVSNLAWGHEDEDVRAAMLAAATELNAYLREEIERHRVEQPDDLFTTMIRAAADGGVMSDDEVRAAAVLLLAAGYDTTAKLLSNALVAFEDNPGQRALLKVALQALLRLAPDFRLRALTSPRRSTCAARNAASSTSPRPGQSLASKRTLFSCGAAARPAPVRLSAAGRPAPAPGRSP
jgi:cytochrome P450